MYIIFVYNLFFYHNHSFVSTIFHNEAYSAGLSYLLRSADKKEIKMSDMGSFDRAKAYVQ